jgi:hypothetical protein
MRELDGVPVGIGKGQDPHHAEVRNRTVGAASGKQVRSQTLERFGVSSAKREMVDPTALEHRPSTRRRDPCELKYMQGRAGRLRSVRAGRDLRARGWVAP